MAVDEAAAVAAAGVWVDQSAAAAAGVTESATGTATAAWASFTGWYSATAVAEQAAAVADLSLSGQDAITGMFSQYVAELVALLRGDRISVPRIPRRPIRNGADPVRVHSRPAELFKETFAITGDEIEAQRQAIERAARLMQDDLMLIARQAQMETMEELEVKRYRRVLRPELSESGPCGLCVVAADRIYKIDDLLPLHGRCKCETVPVEDGLDVGLKLNRADLKRIYAAAGGSTAGKDLKRVRVQINEHGELGPVLSTRGHRFTGPGDIPPPDPAVLEERLGKLNLILGELTKRDQRGENLAAPLAFQRSLIRGTEDDLRQLA